ncbi:GxxExxY protein [Marispirochaeta sp.]|uniref:GxxExxY protein n=1 Tax=Marispirochaeta sp. TaxID=2038653 RepID=UPI0029C84E45|nr:GxxExxY protein [Marispirochaeta sp.]
MPLESVYEKILSYELKDAGLKIEIQKPISMKSKNLFLDEAFRADIIVEDKLILELKSVSEISPVYYKQLLTYLRLSNRKLGLLINFNTELLKNGIKRVINGTVE